MMQTIPAGLQASYDSDVATLATCMYVMRRDGTVFGFTTLDKDLVIDGVTYTTSRGISGTDLVTGNEMNVDTSEVTGMLTSDAITDADVRAGLWDYASIKLFEVDYSDVVKGRRKLRSGWLGEVSIDREQYTVEVIGLMQALTTSIGEFTSPGCRNTLGDVNCKVDLTGGSPPYTFAGSITSVTDAVTLTDSAHSKPDNYYQNGWVTFGVGSANDGITREIKSSTAAGVIVLQLPFPYTVSVGNNFAITVGCNKDRKTCRDKFNNVINFRGEPFLAGNDKMMQMGRRT